MMMSYVVHGASEMHPNTWHGEIDILRSDRIREAVVTARGSSFHLVFGPHSYGHFVCIPNWGIGAELANPADTLWNYESLTRAGLKPVDAYSVVSAISELDTML